MYLTMNAVCTSSSFFFVNYALVVVSIRLYMDKTIRFENEKIINKTIRFENEKTC